MKRNNAERSRRWFAWPCSAVGLTAIMALCPVALAQSFRITSFSVDGGGGASFGERIRVEGTVGRPSAGPLMSGLVYRMEGGIWDLPEAAGQTEGPVLSIQLIDPQRIQISWKGEAGQWQLEQNRGLNPSGWTAVAGAIQAPVLLPSSETAAMFRLRSKP